MEVTWRLQHSHFTVKSVTTHTVTPSKQGTCTDVKTDRATTAVVMQVHEGPGILEPLLLGIHEGLGEANAIVDIVTAATPVKVPTLVMVSATGVGVTTAHTQFTLATGAGDSVDHPC